LRRPFAESPYDGEPECRLALELIQAIGRDPSLSKVEPAEPPDPVQPELECVRDYRLLQKLGEGGMGTVYKALHTQLDKVVALKVLSPERMKNAQAVARFKREMKAVGKLSHPNIVAAFDAGEADGTHYLVMEYVRGIDLSGLLRQHGPLPIADACELVRQAATGLAYAHQNGLVHRDIKPSNIMLTSASGGREPGDRASHQPAYAGRSPAPTLKILDMGLALLDDFQSNENRELTTTGQLMGTVDYMAPEQGSDSHEVDIRADTYSLGATLYKLLCGQAPFAGKQYDTPVKKLMALATKPATPIGERRPEVPQGLSASACRWSLATVCSGGKSSKATLAAPCCVLCQEAPAASSPEGKKIELRLVAPCGIYCGACKELVSAMHGKDTKDIECCGCLSVKVNNWVQTKCKVKPCVLKRGLESCASCPENPCDKLKWVHSWAKEAGNNLKVIREKGMQEFKKQQKARWSCQNCKAPFSRKDKQCRKCSKPVRPGGSA